MANSPAFDAPNHPLDYRVRRALNWIPLGLAYAFFYMGRYNLTVAKSAPMAAILYGVMVLSAALLAMTLGKALWFGGAAVLMISLSVIGVHGILSGTSTTDFGGAKNSGAAVGIVDGMVYLGTGLALSAKIWNAAPKRASRPAVPTAAEPVAA